MIMRKLMLLMTLALSFNTFALQITESDVLAAQEAWGRGIVAIGEVFQNNGDYREAAHSHILKSYDYQDGKVLFKPTLAADIPFRSTVEGALSYFIGENAAYSEDNGFAIKPWTHVRFENHDMIFAGNQAIAMGHYYFTDLNNAETKVEYTLGFVKRENGVVKINVQDSSLPFSNN